MPAPAIDSLKLERLTVEPDDAAIDEQLQRLAESNKSWTDAEAGRTAALGDLVVMDFVGRVGGKEFDGGKGEDMSVELGSGRLIPGFEEGLIGASVGDSREVAVTFPDDYPSANLKGKAASFAVTVKGVRIAGETKVDEDFAKALGLLPWQVDKARRSLNGWTAEALARSLRAVAAADFEVKGGGRDPVYAVERAVLTITREKAAGDG